jgi:hypothetical protein
MSDVVDGDGDGDSRRALPPSPRSEPGSPIVVVQPHNDWPALLPDDEEYVERHAERYRHYIAGDPPRDQDEARARARAGRQVFTGSGAGGALSPLMMVLVHHGLRRNGIALPAGRVVLHRATTSMLYGGPVAEAAWQRVFAEARNLDSWAACRAMAAQAVATVPARRVDAILNGMSGGGYINRGDQEELLRGAAAAGLSADHQANFIAGSDTVGEQQNANAQNADAVVLGAAGAAAQLAHAARAALRGTLRG